MNVMCEVAWWLHIVELPPRPSIADEQDKPNGQHGHIGKTDDGTDDDPLATEGSYAPGCFYGQRYCGQRKEERDRKTGNIGEDEAVLQLGCWGWAT